MSVVRQAARSGILFAVFKGVTQILSWTVTIIVARLLSPADYGLMAIANVLTGYVEVFSELGMGAAIVQRQQISDREFSSNFWFSLLVGTSFAGLAYALAYPTAWLFNEPRVIPVTQFISIFFVIGALMTVPFNILMRDLRFMEIGIVQLVSVALSSGVMLAMAYAGYGVWTLVIGPLVARSTTVILVFAISKWRPHWHYRWDEVRGFLRFGLNVAGARSLFFVFQKADVFLVGTMLGTQAVGFYSFAMNLASMPTDKVASVVNQMAFPLFSRFQTQPGQLRDLYSKSAKFLAIVVAPLYLAGAVWGDDLIRAILGEHWAPIIWLFRAFCVAQLATCLMMLNSPLHMALGRAHWPSYFYAVCVPIMSAAIFLSARHGLEMVAIPWLTVFPLLCLGWTIVTLRSVNLDVGSYLGQSGLHVLIAVAIAVLAKALVAGTAAMAGMTIPPVWAVAQECSVGIVTYSSYLWWRERDVISSVWSLRKA